MDTRREVLEKYFTFTSTGEGQQIDKKKQIDNALTALDKLEKEKMLEMVGEDNEPIYNESGGITVNKKSFEFGKQVGSNQAKAEIRQKLRGL